MRQRLLTIPFCTLFLASFLNAQTGCPGCVVNVPASFPADTIYLPDLPDGVEGTPYNQDISFRLPKTTTPVNAIDSTTPPGLTINKFEILGLEGLPQGLYWQLSQSEFNPANETDGCIKICGTPLQSDSFVLTVRLKATVFVITQVSEFPMSLYIAPKMSVTDGFTLTNPTGCGNTVATFTNNVPSGDADGFTYAWDFGDGTSSMEEDPAPHTYSQPGSYEVAYEAIVDTAGYRLESINVMEIDCTDPLFYGNPDLFIEIYAPDGNFLYSSSPYINDTQLPHVFPVNIQLAQGNYTLKVIDEDGGIVKGGDDDCGTLSFNFLSDGMLIAGGLTVDMNILHPVDTIRSVDTVTVYPQPSEPSIGAPAGLTACAGATNLVLVSSYGFGNQWLLNGTQIANATDFIYQPTTSGYYQVRYATNYGCVATSDSAHVVFHPLPAVPAWFNYNNSLRLTDTAALPAQYALQWYNASTPIPGETGFQYCSMESGTYGLVVTDLATGCTNSYSAAVTHNPNFDCTIGTKNVEIQTFEIVPNPTDGMVWVHLAQPLPANARLRVWDATGRMVQTSQLTPGTNAATVDLGQLSAGVYALEIVGDGFRGMGRVVLR